MIMKELNIGRILIENRHKRGITQEDLAEYMGVSKASVSKWETATTYPDITLLPRLASYFNISIDELIGYEPQMTRSDIRRLYRQISRDFSAKPFEEVLAFCRETADKYYACAPLLFQLGCLYVNHCMLAGTPEARNAVLEEALALFLRVKQENSEAGLTFQALTLEAFCLMQLGKGAEAIDLLTPFMEPRMAPDALLSTAYLSIGKKEEARRTLQVGIYQSVLELINLLLPYLSLCEADSPAFEKTRDRSLAVAEAFELQTLHPSILLSLYLTLAQESMRRQNTEQALAMLKRYTDLAVSDIYPLKLHGDSYFNLLEDWIEEMLPLGSDLPRSESVVRKSLRESVSENPAFASLHKEKSFQTLLLRLKANEEVPA